MNIREWAIEQGYTVGKRGRIHADIHTAYAAREDIEDKPVVLPPLNPIINNNVMIRKPETLYIYDEGCKIAYDMCFTCAQHMCYCNCKAGPTPPKLGGKK